MPQNVPVRGWHSRGYMPHFDGREMTQSVTFRLGDGLPTCQLEALAKDLEQLPEGSRDRVERERLEDLLAVGHGWCILKDPKAAKIVEDALMYFDGVRYKLVSWCIMPNHVHVLLTIESGVELGGIAKSWKTFTANEIRRVLGVRHPEGTSFWQREHWDRFIRNEEHFVRCQEYIEWNPVKAKLCGLASQWRWSSAWEGVRG